jgi:hypothetical protein
MSIKISSFKLLSLSILVIGAFSLFLINPSNADAACANPTPTTAAAYETLLRNTPINGRWYHGDGGFSVQLPNGKKLWIFGDTFSGIVNSKGTQVWGDKFVHNSALLTDKGCVSALLGANDTNGNPTAWFKPTGSLDIPNVDDYYWVNTPYMDGSNLQIFLLHMKNDANGFHIIGADIATLNVSGATPTLVNIKPTPGSNNGDNAPWWGAAIIRDNFYTYIYGSLNKHEPYIVGHYYYLARVPNGQVTNQSTWRYWTGSTWSTNQADVQPVINSDAGLAAAATIYQNASGQNVLISKKNDVYGTDLKAWKTPYFTGWTEQATPLIAPIPNVNTAAQEKTYLGLAHPHATLASGTLLVSWSLNSDAPNFFESPRYGIYFSEIPKP